jgi:5-formyltetrahydrofolate cyclo-ligase
MMVNEHKKQIRKHIREIKSKISLAEKQLRSEKIFRKLENNTFFQKADCVMVYWSMEDEVQTQDFILKYAGKKEIILPSVQIEELVLRKFDGLESLKTGVKYGIQEPEGEDFIDFEKIDLVIVPGIAFDNENNRMGRGKAYYDGLLPKLNAYKIGVCFDFQLIDAVPTDEHDVKMNEIITD